MTGKQTQGCLPSKMDSAGAGSLSQPGEDLSSQEQELAMAPPSISPTSTSTQPLESPSLLPDSQEEEEEEAWGQLYPHCGSLPR